MAVDELSDRHLIKQFQRGDLKAFDMFILRYQDRLMRLAASSLFVSANTEDAVQEVFLRSYKGLSGFRFGAEPFTWLYRTLKNVCMEMNRKSSGHAPNKSEPTGSMTEYSDALDEELGTQLDNERNICKVRVTVACLPDQQREVLVLRLFEGFSIKQTAKILGCRPGTVKAHLNKAMTNLRQSPTFQAKRKELN